MTRLFAVGVIVVTVVSLFLAAKVGLDRQDRWRCDHGTVEAC